jgi:DNA polymerase III epsilon subunit-like protein
MAKPKKNGHKHYYIACLDIETSGFSRSKNQIVEIGVLIFTDQGRFIYGWECLIKPYTMPSGEKAEFDPKAEEVNNISLDMLTEKGYMAPDAAHSFNKIMEFYNVRHVIGHNVEGFDLPRINDFLEQFSKPWEFHHAIDTLKLAKKVVPGLESYSLTNLRDHFEIQQHNTHRALSDAHVTWELWQKLEKQKSAIPNQN